MQTHHWVFSDLQFFQKECDGTTLLKAVDDILELGLPLNSTWLLGDIAYGSDAEKLQQATKVIPAQLARLGVPVYYVMGNHEIDYLRITKNVYFPLHEQALTNPQWHVAELDDFYFTEIFGDTLVVFMGDHAAKDGSWFISHGSSSNQKAYPHSPQAYEQLRKEIAAYGGSVVIASHYSLPGGQQRPSELLSALLPLPANVTLHLHGHAHIGDIIWNKENPWQRNNPVQSSAIRQINISAMETKRSPGSHSAILTLDSNSPTRLRIRCSQQKQWVEEFILPAPLKIL